MAQTKRYVFRRIRGKVRRFEVKGMRPTEHVSTKKLEEAMRSRYKLQDAKGNVREYAPEEVHATLRSRWNKQMDKMDKDYNAEAAKFYRMKYRMGRSVEKGPFSFHYGKEAFKAAKKHRQGFWVTSRGSKAYIFKKKKVNEEIPF